MERWNAGDLDGVLDLYSDDAVMHPSAEWPEQAAWHGREGVRENMEEWRSVWDSSEMESTASTATATGCLRAARGSPAAA